VRLDDERREVEVPGEILAELLGCRQTNLRQNYGAALVPCEARGLYRLETVPRAVETLRQKRSKGGALTADQEENLRLRNAKLRADTQRIRLATRDALERVKAHAREELLDELTDLTAMLREEIRGLPAELVEAHNRWIGQLARTLEAKRNQQAVLTEEDGEVLADLKTE
jgi:hypothetical protein